MDLKFLPHIGGKTAQKQSKIWDFLKLTWYSPGNGKAWLKCLPHHFVFWRGFWSPFLDLGRLKRHFLALENGHFCQKCPFSSKHLNQRRNTRPLTNFHFYYFQPYLLWSLPVQSELVCQGLFWPSQKCTVVLWLNCESVCDSVTLSQWSYFFLADASFWVQHAINFAICPFCWQ